jgi:hypothetical protein
MKNPRLAQRKKRTRKLLRKATVARGRWRWQERARQDRLPRQRTRQVVLPRQERQQDGIVEREEEYCDEGDWEIRWMG